MGMSLEVASLVLTEEQYERKDTLFVKSPYNLNLIE